MGLVFFVFGCAVGAGLAWLVSRGEPSRSALLALNGIVCGLLGALTLASWGANAPAIQTGLGLLGTAAPLTLCMAPFRAVTSRAEIHSVVRHLAVTLAIALVSGISCATLGFVSVASVRHISGMESPGELAGYPIMMSPKRVHTPGTVSSHRS